jgi:hypothetical protein
VATFVIDVQLLGIFRVDNVKKSRTNSRDCTAYASLSVKNLMLYNGNSQIDEVGAEYILVELGV